MRSIANQQSKRLWVAMSLFAALLLNPTIGFASDLDPVVADVVEMLQSQVDEGVILTWLETTDRRPVDVGSRGIIALTEAGASQELITVLLQRVEGFSAQEHSVEGGEADGVETVESRETAATAEPGGGDVEAVFQLRAKRVWVDEDEPDSPREPEWWVYLYLDGDLVSWTRPALSGEPVEARRVLAAGEHEMRVVLQRYEEMRGGWLHESLSVPTPVHFEARAGEALQIDVEMVRIWGLWRQRQDGGPMRYIIRQGSAVLAENAGTGGDPNRWQSVCEDVEANFPDADTTPKRFRNAMSRCVRWAELWTGPGRSTDRAAILADLAQYDFEPPVR